MTIVGICLFSLFFLAAVTPDDKTKAPDADALEAAVGLCALYGLALAIVGLIQANKVLAVGRNAIDKDEPPPNLQSPKDSKIVAVQPFEEELRKLASLKRAGIVSEEEFNQKKKELLEL